ncbi:MAG: AhpC/TSA family protein [Acidobacteria bacterium]|nr:AhpC/TSA family protein [Acidobacteriota bacterium]
MLAVPVMAGSPVVGESLPDFTLTSTRGKAVRLSELTAGSPVALIVLRGYPGYQCPLCQRQVHDFVKHAAAFEEAGVKLVFVYPGPPDALDTKATQFLQDKNFPDSFEMLLDPGYEFTNLFGLRWDAPKETAYPSTFLIEKGGTLYFQKVAKLHGGRTTAAEVLELLPRKRAGKSK